MSKEELDLFVASAKMLEDSSNARVCGTVKVELKRDDRNHLMVYLSYGDKEDCFNTEGYTFAYNMKRLFNNDVTDAINR